MDFAVSVADALETRVKACVLEGGGDINRGWRIELADGRRLFAKSRPGGSVVEFQNEAAGLAWLGDVGALSVPQVAAIVAAPEEPGLVLEWVEPGESGDEADLGRGLALIHQAGARRFDQLPDGASGDLLRFGAVTVQLRMAEASAGFGDIYAGRLRDLARQAYEQGALGSPDRRVIEAAAERATEIVPVEPPARVHGDLWSGNVLWSDGRPWLIDPAAHGGHRELDLAMLELFGNPGTSFYAAYEEVEPLSEGFRGRIGFWQLQPLLVHAVLFGGGYGRSAAVTARRYLT